MTYGTPYHAIGHQVLPHPLDDVPGCLTERNATLEITDLILREVEDFPRGDKHFNHVPPPTYLICLSPKDFYR